MIGGYLQDNRAFIQRGIVAPGLRSGNVDFIPIVGAEAQYYFDGFKVFSVITPIVFNVGIGLDF